MPVRAPRVCPRCSRLFTARRCSCSHNRSDHRNGSTYRWRALRAVKLANDPACQWHEGCGRPAVEVDHIKTVLEAPEREYDYDNLQSLCHDHHVIKTAEDRERLKGYVY